MRSVRLLSLLLHDWFRYPVDRIQFCFMIIESAVQEYYGGMKLKPSHAKIGWLLVLTLFPYSSGYNLSYRNETCCSLECEWKGWDISCPNETNAEFQLQLYAPEVAAWKFGDLHCWVTDWWWSDFEVEPGESLYEVNSLEIHRCPLPEVTFAEIVRKLGLRNVRNVTFSSRMNLNSSMMHRHLLNLETIEYLYLPRNGFTELPSDLLRDVTEIREVDLSFNNITKLPIDLFDGLRNLSIINLDYNEIEMIDWRMFGNCRSLENLYLKRNHLTTLSDEIFRNAGLLYLDVAENQLETLPDHISVPTKRLTLDISGNKFDVLPKRLFDGVSMTKIILCDNSGNLTTLPDYWLSNLTQLETVNLARNLLTILPETIFWSDIQLQFVDLGGNVLSSIPANIFRDTKELTFLDLSGNMFNFLPDNLFRGLSKLTTINLENNNLTIISENLFSGLSSLAELNLGSNSIATIHQAAFENLLSLRVVRLSHNFVKLSGNFYSGEQRFDKFRYMEKIFLDHNHLDGLFNFSKLLHGMPPSLRSVDMSYNSIRRIELSGIPAGSRDVTFDFSNNKLHDIFITEDAPEKIDILIDNNTFSCGCSLYITLIYLKGNTHTGSQNNIRIVPGDAVCGEPSWMANVYVADIKPEAFTCRPLHSERYVFCAEGCDCWWITHNATRLVNCTSRNMEEVPKRLIEFLDDEDEKQNLVRGRYIDDAYQWLHWQKSSVKLDLADNSLVEIPSLNGTGYEYVYVLILSRNNISKLSFDVLPPRLQVLYLDDNNLKKFDQVAWNALISSPIPIELNFEGNPWSCDSDTRRALDLMENEILLDLRYPTKKCLDHRNPSNSEKKSTLYISYTAF